MAKVTLAPNRTNVVDIELCKSVNYQMDTSNAKIEMVKIENEKFKPANLVNILNGVSWILQKKDNKIVENYNDARQWQETAGYWKVSYKKLRMRVFSALLVLITLGGVAFYIWSIPK